jgi:hypothetical protein
LIAFQVGFKIASTFQIKSCRLNECGPVQVISAISNYLLAVSVLIPSVVLAVALIRSGRSIEASDVLKMDPEHLKWQRAAQWAIVIISFPAYLA